MPRDFVWPTWKGKPQSFLAQIDLSAIPAEARTDGLPSAGLLSFFYSAEQDTWGFDPKNRGSWRVTFFDKPADAQEQPFPKNLPKAARFTEVPVALLPIQTYPDLQDDRVAALGLDDPDEEAYDTLRNGVFGNRPAHQLWGYPIPIQGNDMDLECQLASHGIYCGDSSGYESPQRAALEKDRGDWLLLLQLDSDDDANMMWGDAGRLYFWITKSDLARRDFSKVWMILQCY